MCVCIFMVLEKPMSDSCVDLWEDSRVEDELSHEEIQMVYLHMYTHIHIPSCFILFIDVFIWVQFEQENQRLVSEMNSLVDEVR